MKKVLQLFLFILLVLISIFFYVSYFKDNKLSEKNDKQMKNQILIDNQNNLIKNLKYQVKFENKTEYNVAAELSEITYENEIEIVKMQMVKANFIDKDNTKLTIKSDKAIYNNSNYNTRFEDNILIKYMNNIIQSKNLELNFTENIITITGNVQYEGLKGLVKADSIKIDLITKNVEISMNNLKNKVEVESK